MSMSKAIMSTPICKPEKEYGIRVLVFDKSDTEPDAPYYYGQAVLSGQECNEIIGQFQPMVSAAIDRAKL